MTCLGNDCKSVVGTIEDLQVQFSGETYYKRPNLKAMERPPVEIAREFKLSPFGNHSPELQELLKLMRSQPIPGKHFLFMTKTQKEWVLGQLSTHPPQVYFSNELVVFDDLKAAEWHVFKIRWLELFGSELQI